jgi:uncharacterized protein (TIGR03437 family)
MDRNTGAIQWKVALADSAAGGYLWSSLMLYQNSIYIGIASLTDCPLVRGGLARIPLTDPTHPLIAYLTAEDVPGASVWSTPAIDEANNLLYVTTGNTPDNVEDASRGIWGTALLALDATTLTVQKYFFMPVTADENDPDWGSSPLLFTSGGDSFVAANGKNGMMYVLHRPDLSLVWTYKLARDCDSPTLGCGSISTPAFNGTYMISGSGQPDGDSSPPGVVYAFDPSTQGLSWMYPARAAVLAPVTLTPGLVFASTTNGLVALDAASGAELWSDGSGVGLYSQPVVSNGVLYTTYINGDVVAWAVGANGGGGGATLAASPGTIKVTYTIGGPSPVAQPVAVSSSVAGTSFTINSDSAWLTTDVSSGSTPATVNVQAAPFVSSGIYSGNLTLATTDGNAFTVRVTFVVNPPTPTPPAIGIVNAASFQPGLAPGGLFSVFASNLSADVATPLTLPWPASWNGISVKINGTPAPLAYVSATQINAQVPFGTSPGRGVLTIESNGVSSRPVNITIQPTAPGIFTDTSGHAAALNQDFTPNQPQNPAASGSYISVYLTGQGMVDQPPADGVAAPSDSVANTTAETTATIDDMPVTVSFSGLAPGYAGLGQVNLLVPDLPAGDHLLVVTIGGVRSNAALVSTSR